MKTRWLLVGLLLTLTALATTALVIWGEQIRACLADDVFKMLCQLVLIVGVGGVASLVLDELNRARELRDANLSLLRSTLSDLVRSYNDIKRLRRLLRAQSIRPNVDASSAFVLRDEYSMLLQQLNEAQLTLETQARLIEGNKDRYPHHRDLHEGLEHAEKYVGHIIKEWEENLGSFTGTPLQKPLAELHALCCFVSEASRSFEPSFSKPMSKAMTILAQAIGEPRKARSAT
jgi:hypothetical protein